jgi:hypothetical protein
MDAIIAPKAVEIKIISARDNSYCAKKIRTGTAAEFVRAKIITTMDAIRDKIKYSCIVISTSFIFNINFIIQLFGTINE